MIEVVIVTLLIMIGALYGMRKYTQKQDELCCIEACRLVSTPTNHGCKQLCH